MKKCAIILERGIITRIFCIVKIVISSSGLMNVLLKVFKRRLKTSIIMKSAITLFISPGFVSNAGNIDLKQISSKRRG